MVRVSCCCCCFYKILHCVSEKNAPTLKWYSSKLYGSNRVCMFQFSCRFAFLSTFCRLSNRTPKIMQILTLHQANVPTLMRCNFFTHTPELIIFGTHNLYTFRHKTIINELLLMQFYLFNICPKLHHQK